MVRDGYFYAVVLIAAGILLGWLTRPAWAVIPFLLAVFFLWFFRDPERSIPTDAGAVVSPGDGKVTDVATLADGDRKQLRVSIFLSVFDVHVNRSPIAGIVRSALPAREISECHERHLCRSERAEHRDRRRR